MSKESPSLCFTETQSHTELLGTEAQLYIKMHNYPHSEYQLAFTTSFHNSLFEGHNTNIYVSTIQHFEWIKAAKCISGCHCFVYICPLLLQPLIPCYAKYLYLYYKDHSSRYLPFQSRGCFIFSISHIGRILYINKVPVQWDKVQISEQYLINQHKFS